jgi:protection of telomeres protein 1
MWAGVVSVLANVASEFHILPSGNIPAALPRNSKAPWQSVPLSKCRPPSSVETSYIIWANNHITNLCLPASHEFQDRAKRAMNIKEKFCLLKDIKADSYHDILGEVVRVYEGSGSMTVYLSDYTANSFFYNHVWGNGGNAVPRDGDEFGYIKSRSKTAKDWPGPFGKMSIQLTLFDEHADFVREEKVHAKQWLLLKNVKIKFGRMGGCLEGVLRGDRGAFEGKVHVQIMEQSDEPDQIDARWKEAVRRKHEWWKKFEKQKQDILDEAAGLGDKRKRGVEVVTKNARQRRKELRAAAEAKVANTEAKVAKRLDLNDNSELNRCMNRNIAKIAQYDPFTPTNPLCHFTLFFSVIRPG